MTAWANSHSHGFPPAARRAILQRDPVCPCGRPSTQADHIVPVAEGGSDDESNGQGLCRSCHDTKTAAEAARARARVPRRHRDRESHPGLL